jgi:GMP synthase-like glutamine amidotransferase
MRIHFLQHVPFEGPAHLVSWAESGGHVLSGTALFDGTRPPPIEQVDALVVLGGPMGANDDADYWWMPGERAYIRQAITQNRPVLGICLGAQLIAAALGADVKPNEHREIGWFPVRQTPEAHNAFVANGLPAEFMAFHWHSNRFDVPEGATRLFTSEGCAEQGFLYRRALALQFHLEATPESVGSLLENCPDDLQDGPYVQSAEAIRSDTQHFGAAHDALFKLLDRLLA